jgi:alpha-N-arabinofuranosidase
MEPCAGRFQQFKGYDEIIAATPDNVPFDERRNAINGALQSCLRLTVEKAGSKVGIANEGYWGIPVKPNTTYKSIILYKRYCSIPAIPPPRVSTACATNRASY